MDCLIKCLRGSLAQVLPIGLMLAMAAAQMGCSGHASPRPTPPLPTFTGPTYLQGTVASMTRLKGYEPLLTSGYGLVVNLSGSGSSEVPAYLRRWLINEMRKKGVGSAALGTAGLTPERMLASTNTAVVVVQGLIPPGAIKGTRFDVLVSCLPQTQTTSLEGGQLWSTDLSVDGASPTMRFSRRQAVAAGPVYINPFDQRTPAQKQLELQRQAVVLSGGVATSDRHTLLILHQRSWQRSRLIADRINERFPKAPTDHRDTAVAIDDTQIQLNIPARYGGRSKELLDLISHLFTQRAPGFEQVKAKQLASLLSTQPQLAERVKLAWIAMGKTVLPVIRPYYDHSNQVMSLAALEAGARMNDERVTGHLQALANQPDAQLRRRVAKILLFLPGSVRGTKTLQTLLNDPNTSVRIEAYESLAAISDPVIRRAAIDGPNVDRFKFVLDLVPSRTPLIYVAQHSLPRLVIFDPMLGFQSPFLAHMWDNRLMLRANEPDQAISVFFQKPGQVEGKTFRIGPTVANLVYLMGHRPSVREPQDGLDLTYSQVVNAIYRLCQQGAIVSDTHLQTNPLAAAIAHAAQISDPGPRPEVDPTTAPRPFERLDRLERLERLERGDAIVAPDPSILDPLLQKSSETGIVPLPEF